MAVRVIAILDRGLDVGRREGFLERLAAATRKMSPTLAWWDADLAKSDLTSRWCWWWYSEEEDFTGRLADYLRRPHVWAAAPEPQGLSLELWPRAAVFHAGLLWDRFVSDGETRDAFRILTRGVADTIGATTALYMADEWAPSLHAWERFEAGQGFDESLQALIASTLAEGSFTGEPAPVKPTRRGYFGIGSRAGVPRHRAWPWFVERFVCAEDRKNGA